MENDTKSKPAKAKYVVESPIEHDGRPYVLGDEIELTESEAKPLLASGDVSTPETASPEAKEAPKLRAAADEEREAAAARAEYDKAVAAAAAADQALKDATAAAEAAKRRAEAAKARLAKLKPPAKAAPAPAPKPAAATT